MKNLHEKMEEVTSIFEEISELEIEDGDYPREMTNILALLYETVRQEACNDNDKLPYKFDSYIRPELEKLQHFDSRYMPSVLQTIKALSTVVFFANNRLQNHSDMIGNYVVQNSLSRQHSPLPEYVRSFDVQIVEDGITVDKTFCLPPSLMAIQSQVALGLVSVDEKKIYSARKTKTNK